MIRLPHAALFAAAAFVLSGCDNRPLEVVPEVDRTFGFEAGLEDWVPSTVGDADGSSTVTVSTEQASAGASSLRLSIDEPSGIGAARITRLFELEPSRAYDIELGFQLGTADGATVTPWAVVAGAGPATPGAAGPPEVGTTATTDGFAFEARTASFTATTDPDGALFVTLGVRQDTPGSRVYFLDEVRVALTRR